MQTILLTGANGNLGKAVAGRLLAAGYHLEAAVGRSGSEMPESEAFRATSVDLMDEAVARAFVEQAAKRSHDLSAGILLVGGFAAGDLAATDGALLDKMFALNFKTAWNVAQPLFQQLVERGGGQIILVGSRGPLEPGTALNTVAYSLSKSLVFHLAELLNAAGKKHHITATVLVPSIIDTPQNRSSMPDADPSKWVSAEAIAELIAFTLSETGGQLRHNVLKLYNHS